MSEAVRYAHKVHESLIRNYNEKNIDGILRRMKITQGDYSIGGITRNHEGELAIVVEFNVYGSRDTEPTKVDSLEGARNLIKDRQENSRRILEKTLGKEYRIIDSPSEGFFFIHNSLAKVILGALHYGSDVTEFYVHPTDPKSINLLEKIGREAFGLKKGRLSVNFNDREVKRILKRKTQHVFK